MAGYFGSDFDPSVPPDTELLSEGSSRIRDIKQRIKTFFGSYFNLDSGAWNSNVIPSAALATISGVAGSYTNVSLTVSSQGLITAISSGSTGSYKAAGAVETYTTGGTGISSAPTNGQLLVGNGSGYTLATITAASGISVTNGTGSITIAFSPTSVLPQAPFYFSGTLTSSAATTPVTLVAALTSASPYYGRKLHITRFLARVDGATAWAGSVSIINIADTNGTPNVFATLPVAALTANARVGEWTSGVVLSDALSRATGGATNAGIQVYADATASAGSNLIIQVEGYYV
jgi:hypothetical protein